MTVYYSFLLCRNSQPLADWLAMRNDDGLVLISFEEQGRSLRVHNALQLPSDTELDGFVEVERSKVNHVIFEATKKGMLRPAKATAA